MNYQTLKGMLENLIKSYKCPMCMTKITETSIDVIGAAGATVNIDIECPSCHKHAMIRAEVAHVDIANLPQIQNKIKQIQGLLGGMKTSRISSQTNGTTKIYDDEIVSLSKELKLRKLTVSDLFGEDVKE